MKRPKKNNKLLLIIGVVLLLGASFAAYIYINNSKNVAPTDSSAGVLKSCFSTVEEISNSYTCAGGKYAKATFKCVGGYTGTVGDGKACKTKEQLKSMAETACVKYANCQMLKPAYSETFTSTSFKEENWTLISRQSHETRTFNSNGLNLTTTKPKTDIWHEIRLSDQNINEDFSMELKGVKVDSLEGAMTLFSLRGFKANSSVNWVTAYGPTNWNSMDLLLKRTKGKMHILSNRKVNGVSKSSGKNIVVPDTTSSVDFRITRMNKIMVLEYNIGAGYVEINRNTSHDWINNYVVLSAFTPKKKTTTASFKSFDYKNVSGNFALKSKYAETFTSSSFSTDNWTITWKDAGLSYSFNSLGINIKDSGSNQKQQYSVVDFDKKLVNDFVVEMKNIRLDKASSEKSFAYLFIQGNTLANAKNDAKWDQVALPIRRTATGYEIYSTYSKNGHGKWVTGTPVAFTDLTKGVNVRISSIGHSVTVEADTGSGYKQFVKVEGVTWKETTARFGIFKPAAGKATASFGSFSYKAR